MFIRIPQSLMNAVQTIKSENRRYKNARKTILDAITRRASEIIIKRNFYNDEYFDMLYSQYATDSLFSSEEFKEYVERKALEFVERYELFLYHTKKKKKYLDRIDQICAQNMRNIQADLKDFIHRIKWLVVGMNSPVPYEEFVCDFERDDFNPPVLKNSRRKKKRNFYNSKSHDEDKPHYNSLASTEDDQD